MSALAARCARPMRRYKAGPREVTECGRPTGHAGRCRSREACARYYAADSRRITEKRRRDRLAGKARNQGQAGRAAVTAVRTGSQSGCGTYLAWLLHMARGEAPCIGCALAAIRMLSGLSGANRAALRRAA
jgi:hypothetical protein